MCVILYANINNQHILAKNRDRPYNHNIEIIHEILNGVEVAYIKDTVSGWIEGMNENGDGMVNSTLNNKDYGNDNNKNINNNNKTNKKNKIFVYKTKHNKMYKALGEMTRKKFFNDLLQKDKDNHYLLEGHTLVSFNNKIYHIENDVNNNYTLKNVSKPVVYSNYGISLPNYGYKTGVKGVSAFLRKQIVKKELNEVENNQDKYKNLLYDKLASMLNKNYINLDPRFHPYRDIKYTQKIFPELKYKKRQVRTTGQLILNTTKKDFVYYNNTNTSSKNVKYINKLPKNYAPKIRVIINNAHKNLKPYKMFTRKYLNKIYKKFGYENVYNNTKKIKDVYV